MLDSCFHIRDLSQLGMLLWLWAALFVTVTLLKLKFQFGHQFGPIFGKTIWFYFLQKKKKKSIQNVVGWQIIASRQKVKQSWGGDGPEDGAGRTDMSLVAPQRHSAKQAQREWERQWQGQRQREEQKKSSPLNSHLGCQSFALIFVDWRIGPLAGAEMMFAGFLSTPVDGFQWRLILFFESIALNLSGISRCVKTKPTAQQSLPTGAQNKKKQRILKERRLSNNRTLEGKIGCSGHI